MGKFDALDIECPDCHAGPGEKCWNLRYAMRDRRMSMVHRARIYAAAA